MPNQNQPDLLPAERDYLMKERATLIDRLTFVERRLGVPSSVLNRGERRTLDAYEQRIRAEIGRGER